MRDGKRGLDGFESLRERRQLRCGVAREQGCAEGRAEGAVLPALVIRGRGLPGRRARIRIGVVGVRRMGAVTDSCRGNRGVAVP